MLKVFSFMVIVGIGMFIGWLLTRTYGGKDEAKKS